MLRSLENKTKPQSKDKEMIKLEQNIEKKTFKKSMKKNVGSFKIDKTVG